MLFDCPMRNLQIVCDFLIAPAAVGKHGDRKLCRCQIVCHISLAVRIVYPAPAKTEFVSDGYDFLVIFRIIPLQTGLDQSL